MCRKGNFIFQRKYFKSFQRHAALKKIFFNFFKNMVYTFNNVCCILIGYIFKLNFMQCFLQLQTNNFKNLRIKDKL